MKTALFVLLFGLVASAGFSAETPAPLKLTDGRTFAEWKILSETPSSVFLRYKGGAAKVNKNLLPQDVLAAHPIDVEGARQEAARLAIAARLGDERRAEVEARNVRLNEIAAQARTAGKGATTADGAKLSFDVIEAAARERAEEYFKSQRRNGSGYSLVFDFRTSLLETRAIPGWPDRYEVTGKTWYQYYESTLGGSYASVNSGFLAEVEYRAGDRRPKVVDFRPTARPND